MDWRRRIDFAAACPRHEETGPSLWHSDWLIWNDMALIGQQMITSQDNRPSCSLASWHPVPLGRVGSWGVIFCHHFALFSCRSTTEGCTRSKFSHLHGSDDAIECGPHVSLETQKTTEQTFTVHQVMLSQTIHVFLA